MNSPLAANVFALSYETITCDVALYTYAVWEQSSKRDAMPGATEPSALRKPPATSPQKSKIPDGPAGVTTPHMSLAGEFASHESPIGWLLASNAGYGVRASPESAAEFATLKLCPYEATPRTSWFAGKPAAVFGWLQRLGNVADAEMARVFNLGVGFVVVAAPFFADSIVAQLGKMDVPAWVIGEVRAGEPGVEFV